MALRTVAGLTLAGERRAISSEDTGAAEWIYSATRMFKIVPARSENMTYQINRIRINRIRIGMSPTTKTAAAWGLQRMPCQPRRVSL